MPKNQNRPFLCVYIFYFSADVQVDRVKAATTLRQL